jgi:hypothetical protein
MWRCVKLRKNARTVSSPGNRLMPRMACNARSPRSQSVCAKRLAPVTTASKNAVNVCASGIALFEVGAGNGIALATRTPKPICSKKATKLIKPPKGVTAFGVSLIRIFVAPNNGLNAASTVLWAVSSWWFSIPTYLPECPSL